MLTTSRFVKGAAALVVAAGTHAGLMAWWNAPTHPVDIRPASAIASLSFSPNQRDANPEKGDAPSTEEIAADLKVVRAVTNRVRTYTVSQNLDQLPAIAQKEGVKVSLGLWVDNHDPERTTYEFKRAVELARKYRSVSEIYVGNESILRQDATPDELVALMKKMRAATDKPVSTGETWDIWLKYPQLAKTADFIAAHVLPYWEGVPADQAVKVAFERYDALKAAFPNKRVVIAEFGWPSAKFNRGAAEATPENQAMVVREFVAQAQKRGAAYNLIEAFDQPWKTKEGDVGPYWGIFDAARQPKFALWGEVVADPFWQGKVAAGVGLGALIAVAFLMRRRVTFVQGLAIAASAQAIGFALAAAFAAPFEFYANAGLIAMWVVSVPLIALLVATSFDRMRELADVLLGRRPERLILPADRHSSFTPKVSVHVPACNEQPHVLTETLEALARLDYPNFEVLAVVNNTTKPELVDPIREVCERLGGRFKFVYLPKISGFKAGALNRALEYTAEDAEIIAVVDADYTVDPSWLADLVPAFKDPKVALVQAPQEHRDQHESVFKHAMNAEYAGFFDVGMVQRNEDDAIIAHGTMIMLRRRAMAEVGNWSEWCITEDTELGLRLFEAGYSATYTNRRYGQGILPDTLRAYRRQRDRWAYGAMRIMLAHWKHMLPGSKTLNVAQKYHFLTGWLHWIGDAVAVTLAVANLGWVAWMQLSGLGEPPAAVLTASTAIAAGLCLMHMFAIYAVRVKRGTKDALLAAVAGVSLQWTVAKAVFTGLVLASLPFNVTAKGGKATTGFGQFVRGFGPEFLLGGLLSAASAFTALTNKERVFELDAFALVLAIQAIPFLAAAGLGTVEFAKLTFADRTWMRSLVPGLRGTRQDGKTATA
ncbi:MAG TPA: glycosyltransferase [Azospirillaceae bacterium]|nr:glycosyltransferase [Azospirillaceae bacterium]